MNAFSPAASFSASPLAIMTAPAASESVQVADPAPVAPEVAAPILPAPAAVPGSLAGRAMLASVTIRAWSARRLDKSVTAKATADHGAADDAGRFNKALLDPSALAEITKLQNAAREDHYRLTLPWGRKEERILSVANYFEYCRVIRARQAEFDAAVAKFLAAYPDHREARRVALGAMFDPADYPPPADIARRFEMDMAIYPLPESGDFRAVMSEAARAEIVADMERRTAEATAGAVRSIFERIQEHVGRMAERLAAYKPGTDGTRAQGVFRDSLVANVKELAELLPALNVTGDPAIAALADRMATELCRFDAVTLRENDNGREKTAKAAAAILADVESFLA